jgi:gluconate 5-dehydrogenase
MQKVEYPHMTLDGKIALVTGASKGLGKWISLGLAHAGADVVVAARGFQGVKETAGEIEEMGRRALPIQADVSQINSIKEMVRKTITHFGRIDCLVNNAGVNVHKTAFEITPEDFDLIANLNFRGLYFTSQIVAKEMINTGGGKIVNIGSVGGFLLRAGIPNSVYAGTKGGVSMLTKAFAEELSPYRIYVNAVAPGYFATPLAEDRLSNKELLEKILFFTPLKRIGEARDIIGPVVFLASDASDFITGQTIYVDGGRSIL